MADSSDDEIPTTSSGRKRIIAAFADSDSECELDAKSSVKKKKKNYFLNSSSDDSSRLTFENDDPDNDHDDDSPKLAKRNRNGEAKEKRLKELEKMTAKRNLKRKLNSSSNQHLSESQSPKKLLVPSDPSNSEDSSNSDGSSEEKPKRKSPKSAIESSESSNSDSNDTGSFINDDSTEESENESRSSSTHSRPKTRRKRRSRSVDKIKKTLEFSTEESSSDSNDQVIEAISDNDSNESEYEQDGFVDDTDSSFNCSQEDFVRKELSKATKRLTRSSTPMIESTNKYLNALYEQKQAQPSPKKKKALKKDEPDEYVYERLVKGLRSFATDPDLPSREIIDQFRFHSYSYSPYDSEKCVCGKEEIKHIYFMKNKLKKDDLVDYAFTTVVVGSICIQHWFIARHSKREHLEGQKPFELEFMKWAEKGIIGHFRKRTFIRLTSNKGKKIKHPAWLITISSKAIARDFEGVNEEYEVDMARKKNDAISLKIKVPKSEELPDKDSRHRFYLKFELSRPNRLIFTKIRMESAASTQFRSSEPTRGKDFLK